MPPVRLLCVLLFTLTLAAADRPWQRLSLPSTTQAAAAFRNPPPETAMTLWWYWNGPMRESDITRDLDEIQAHGVKSVLIWAYNGLEIEYLSDTWFERIRFAVAEARKRNLRVWLMDEGSYPSGFAGGAFTRQYPNDRMKALVASKPIPAPTGREISLDVPKEALGAWATERTSRHEVSLPVNGPTLRWTPPPGEWDIRFAQWQFRTPATRYVSNPGFPKNGDYSLFDFLDPAAARRFLALVHERYRAVIGHEFGSTVLGFMGDETDCAWLPWTPRAFDAFQQRKGYDIRPHLAQLLSAEPSPEARRLQADYYDVWSALLQQSFYKTQSEWCAAHGLEYIVHLNSEDNMKGLVRVSGDYFRSMRHVQIPGVDAIWRQVWPGAVADFPKFASSAAHLYGRPRSFTESYAVYGRGITLEQARWVMNQQFVRGINLFQVMSFLSDTSGHREYFCPPDWRLSPQWPQFSSLAEYSNRASTLLAAGRPAARVALFYPTASLWLSDDAPERAALQLARRLLENQHDFDFIDEQGLAEARITAQGLSNLSGQSYRAVIVPPGAALSQAAEARLRQFASAGGKVFLESGQPALIYPNSFRDASSHPWPWAALFASGQLPPLPESDLHLDRDAPQLRYLHRRLDGASLYFLFNEGSTPVSARASLEGRGPVTLWDAESGDIRRLPSKQNGPRVELDLTLDPGQTRFLVLGPEPPDTKPAQPQLHRLSTLQTLDGDWQLRAGPRTYATPLKPWSDLGLPGFSGTGVYSKRFTIDRPEAGAVFLELGAVLYSARVKLNGKDLGPRPWAPFRWDVTAALQDGPNELEIEVRNTAANELSGNPARLQEIEQKGWLKNSYIRTYGKLDAEMVPSGLLGPVRLELWHAR